MCKEFRKIKEILDQLKYKLENPPKETPTRLVYRIECEPSEIWIKPLKIGKK